MSSAIKFFVLEANDDPNAVQMLKMYDEPLPYERIRDEVGGLIEMVTLDTELGIGCYINEEGKLLGLPVNVAGSKACHKHQRIFPSDWISGNMVIVGLGEDGEEASVPDGFVDKFFGALIATS